MTSQHETGVFRRKDGKWFWRIVASNGQVTATDGGQGFTRRVDAEKALAHQLGLSGHEAEPIRKEAVRRRGRRNRTTSAA